MKTTVFIFLLFICRVNDAFSATITATGDGFWAANSTWDLNRTPTNNDEVVIPFGRTVFVKNTPYPKNNFNNRPLLDIKIYGTLDFSDAGNDKLFLDLGSQIQVFSNGRIRTNNNSNEIISIYNGSTENTVWNGSPATMNGPLYATGNTLGFLNGVLPVKLVSFDVVADGNGQFHITWSTAEEQNSAYFEVQWFDATENSWKYAGKVTAAGYSGSLLHYHLKLHYGNAGAIQFRLKQVDTDGSFEYSAIRQVSGWPAKSAIWYDNASRQLYIKDLKSRSAVNLSVFTLAGAQRINRLIGSVAQPVNLSNLLPGIYVVRVTANHDLVAIQTISVR